MFAVYSGKYSFFFLMLFQMEILQPNLDIYFGLASHISDPTHSGKADCFCSLTMPSLKHKHRVGMTVDKMKSIRGV